MSEGEERVWGLHSNIPACCVEHYARRVEEAHRQGEVPTLPMEDYLVIRAIPSLHYAPCPACLSAMVRGDLKPNPLHYCTRECAVELRGLGAPTVATYLEGRH